MQVDVGVEFPASRLIYAARTGEPEPEPSDPKDQCGYQQVCEHKAISHPPSNWSNGFAFHDGFARANVWTLKGEAKSDARQILWTELTERTQDH